MSKVKVGDKLVLISKGKHPIEQQNWAEDAGLPFNKPLTVDDVEEAKLGTWVHFEGYDWHHPLPKFKPYDGKVKLMVCGHGRHGKDTLCEFLATKGYTFNSSSWVAAEAFIFDELKEKYAYASVQECWNDRINKRAEWFDMISAYNGTELTTLAKYIYANYDIYCGIRSPEEFLKARAEGLFELSIWVDASDRLPAEGSDSNGITRDMCDIVLTNNGTLKEFMEKVERFYTILLKR